MRTFFWKTVYIILLLILLSGGGFHTLLLLALDPDPVPFFQQGYLEHYAGYSAVQKQIEFFQNNRYGNAFFRKAYKNYPAYAEVIERRFKEAGLSTDLVFLAAVE